MSARANLGVELLQTVIKAVESHEANADGRKGKDPAWVTALVHDLKAACGRAGFTPDALDVLRQRWSVGPSTSTHAGRIKGDRLELGAGGESLRVPGFIPTEARDPSVPVVGLFEHADGEVVEMLGRAVEKSTDGSWQPRAVYRRVNPAEPDDTIYIRTPSLFWQRFRPWQTPSTSTPS